MMDEATYQNAVYLFEQGKYEQSFYEFKDINNYANYKDTSSYLEKSEMIPYHAVGETVKFGQYEWYIIAKTDESYTLLCKDIVENRAYNDKKTDITWEKCTLRKWLNEDFYNGFTDDEKTMIAKTKCENKHNSEYFTKGGNDTEDYIFLLSLDEAEAVDKSIRDASTSWWLRSPGNDQDYAASVNYDGSLDHYGGIVGRKYGVRPALTIDLSKISE